MQHVHMHNRVKAVLMNQDKVQVSKGEKVSIVYTGGLVGSHHYPGEGFLESALYRTVECTVL